MTRAICIIRTSLCALAFAALSGSANAAFHLVEIEQVIGGVGSDPAAQAVQLRFRFAGQNILAGNVRLVARDAAGLNPIVLSTFPAPNPASGLACRRVLVATDGFAARTVPAAVRDYAMPVIPPGYLTAGSIVFENAAGTQAFWRLSYGGAGYTGPGTVVAATNDNDTTMNPPVATALPATSTASLAFTPACSTLSTTNLAQYANSAEPSIFTNNANAAFTVTAPPPPPVSTLPGRGAYWLGAALALLAGALISTRRRTA